MLNPKGPGRHPRFGVTYFWSLAGVFVTACALAAARWEEDKPLLVPRLPRVRVGIVGRAARRRLRPGWAVHITGMGVSYVATLTAFYVDNGRNLPIWRDLPDLAYWIGPSLAGLPIILATLLRHPLARATPGEVRTPPARGNRTC